VINFKRFVYSPGVLRTLRALKLTEVLRNLRYKLARHEGGVYRVKVHGVRAAFRVADSAQLVSVDLNLALEDEFLQLVIASLGSGDVFMDVGANIGVFTIFAALLVGDGGQVIAFEPEARIYAQLEDNIGVNGLHNVRPLRLPWVRTLPADHSLWTGRRLP